MKYEDELFNIEYNTCDKKYIDSIVYNLKNKEKRIMNFFRLDQLNKKVDIKFWDSIDGFRKFVIDNGLFYAEWLTANAVSFKNMNRSQINCLSLKEYVKAKGHQNDTLDTILKTIVHEFVHICDIQYRNHNKSVVNMKEIIVHL